MGIFPLLPAEASHRAASALTPDDYPFEVSRVTYHLISGIAQCNNQLGHRVAVFVIDGATVPDEPSARGSFVELEVPEDPAVVDDRDVELELEPSLELSEGQSLVVAVEMAATADLSESLCIEACADGAPLSGVDWWSNAAEEPYAWADMVADFGFQENFTIRAFAP